MDRDVRTLLETKAEEMRLAPEIPGGVVKRARRRRVVTAALAGTVTLAAAVGLYAGTRALVDKAPGPSPGQDVQPAAPSTQAPGIFPATEEEIRNIQAQVAEGHQPLWQSPEGVAEMYAVNVLGWELEDVAVRVAGDQPVTAVIANPAATEAAGMNADIRTALTLERVPDTDEGIYVVVRAEAEDLALRSPQPGDPVSQRSHVTFSGGFRGAGPGLTINVEVKWDNSSIGDAVEDPSDFQLTLGIGDIETSPVASVSIGDGSGPVLGITQFRLSLQNDGVALPPAVTATRDAIEEAARLRDWEALERLIPETGFTHTFGGDSDPIAYWQSLEQDGEPVLDILATLLELAPGQDRGIYIWPAPAAENVEDWDQRDLDVLSLTSSERDIRLFQRYGLYVGWRVGIEADGTWVFFVAGD